MLGGIAHTPLSRPGLSLLILLLVLLSACGTVPRIGTGPAQTPTKLTPGDTPANLPASPYPIVTPSPQPTVPPLPPLQTINPPDRTLYSLSVDLDYARHHLTVSEVISYTNRSGVPLSELELNVEPNRTPGAFHLEQLRFSDGRSTQAFDLKGAALRIPLPSALEPGSTVLLDLSYTLDLPAKPGWFGYAGGEANLCDWYPFVLPFRTGTGWLMHDPAAVGEHLVYDSADYQVELHLTGSAQKLTIASPAPAVSQGNSYRYELKQARTFALAIGDKLQSARKQVGSVTVTSYYAPEHAAAGQTALEVTAQALALYSRLFAPYLHPQLTLVEANFPDGLEEDGLYFLGPEYYAGYNGTPQGYLTAIAAHETAHQWWFARVGNDQAMEPWLDEAMATYSELLFYEHTYPHLVDWWWEWRVNRYAPNGWVDASIYDYSTFRTYVNVVYLRGALFLDQLRHKLGDGPFSAFLQDYATRFSGKQATGQDFFAVLRPHTSLDLAPLEAAYFQHPR